MHIKTDHDLVFEINKQRDDLRSLVHDYLNDQIKLLKLKYHSQSNRMIAYYLSEWQNWVTRTWVFVTAYDVIFTIESKKIDHMYLKMKYVLIQKSFLYDLH